MNAQTALNALAFAAAGFASGSVLYSAYLPKLIKGVDVTQESEDKNPGSYNVFAYGGVPLGILCLTLDIGKGFLPVMLAGNTVPRDSAAFAAVMLAPVAGHIYSPLRRFRGGKGIAVSFGVLLALLPEQFLVFALVAAYLISLLIPLRINERRSVVAFAAFALAAVLFNGALPVRAGCLLIAILVGYRNWNDAQIPIPFRRKTEGEQTNHQSK
jgi:glycerol-3-phosphate acyltransferase PlsY